MLIAVPDQKVGGSALFRRGRPVTDGFHRVREYAFLHPKAKTRLRVVQPLLQVVIVLRDTPAKSPICCPRCQAPMRLIGVSFRGRPDG